MSALALLRSIAISGLLVYVALCVWAYVAQDSMLYLPGATSKSTLPPGARLAFSDRALVVEPEVPARAIAILFHGNAGAAADRMFYAEELSRRGIRSVLAEYPGYGWREGAPSEHALIQDGLQLYADVRAAAPPGHPVMVIGESLGSGVAVQVAAKAQVPPDRLVLVTPYANLAQVAQEHLWWLPARWLMRDTFDSARFLPQFSGDVAFLIAAQDEVLGAHSGRELAKHALGRRTHVIELEQAQHNTWPEWMTAQLWDELLGPRK